MVKFVNKLELESINHQILETSNIEHRSTKNNHVLSIDNNPNLINCDIVTFNWRHRPYSVYYLLSIIYEIVVHIQGL